MNVGQVLLSATSVLGSLLTAASPAVADAENVPYGEIATAAERATPAPLERPWLYAGDSQVAAPLQALAISRMTYAAAGSATRPFATNVATPGAVFELGGEVGLLPRLSLQATGIAGESLAGGRIGDGGTVSARLSLLPDALRSTHLVVALGYLRELSGGDGAWTRLSLQHDIDRARFIGTVHGEHVFAPGRDGLDVMVILGASYRAAGPLRLGVEYVGQDLEETFGDAAEGGPRHFAGPTAAVQLLGGRLSIVGGPSFGLARAPSVIGRLAAAVSF